MSGTLGDLRSEGRQRALDLLHRCSSTSGFTASAERNANYGRIWSRDGVVCGLAGLACGDRELIETCRRTLQTLARYQGPHGEIPSNVDLEEDRVSYGSTAGRVDADLWFIIGCCQYWRSTADEAFLDEVWPALEKVHWLLGAWEMNNRGLLYVPQTGDWADEYIQAGYVLYDQALYLRAQQELLSCNRALVDHQPPALEQRMHRLRDLIRSNYWAGDRSSDEALYHWSFRDKSRRAWSHCAGHYWLAYFAPQGFGYRFDAFANVLTSLFGIADKDQSRIVDDYIAGLLDSELPLLPAFHPVITPRDEDWEHLQTTFTYHFKNRPYEYHNGGLWPMITGFYVADLAARGRLEVAERCAEAIHQANRMAVDGRAWCFSEYIHGRDKAAEGERYMAWNAAAALIAEYALEGRPILLNNAP